MAFGYTPPGVKKGFPGSNVGSGTTPGGGFGGFPSLHLNPNPAWPTLNAPPDMPVDTGSGGGGGYAAPPQKSLASSPEWLAYLNALGLEQNQFEADIARQRGVLQSAADQQIGDLTPQFDQSRRGISGGLYARGMERSGEKMTKLAESRAAQGRAVGGIQTALAGQLSGLETQLAGKLMDIGARRASQELALRTQGYQ